MMSASNITTPAPQSPHLILSYPRPNILLVTFNRPKQFNAFPRELHLQLDQVLDWYDSQASLRVCIVTGRGRAFCAGADLKEWNVKNKQNITATQERRTDNGFGGLSDRAGKKPIIAAVNGLCLGGGMEMAVNCDLIIAHESAKFGLPEVKIGVVAIAGALPRIMKIAGRQRASEMAFLGRTYSAEQMKSWGVVNEVVSTDVVKTAVKWAEEIARNSPDSVIVSRAGLLGGWGGLDPKESTEEVASGIFQRMEGAENMNEGVLSFVEGRKPVYRDSKL